MALWFHFLALLCVCVTSVMQWYGMVHGFYWTIPWWDIPVHMLGGLTMSLWAAGVSARLKLTPLYTALWVFALVLVVGIGWEAWQVYEGLAREKENYWLDTIFDVLNDLVGVVPAMGLYTYWFWRKRSTSA